MATWTNIPNTSIETDKPIRAVDGRALRDNVTALAEGASGAPRILTAAYSNLSVTNAKLATDAVTNVKVVNGTLGAEKFQTGTTERDWVLARTAGATLGSLGTYALMYVSSNIGIVAPGDDIPGSLLLYTSAAGYRSAVAGAGTWKCMGAADSASGASGDASTTFLRIA